MLNLFRSAPEWVHFIDIRESSICFLLQHPCKAGTQMRLRFPLNLPSPHRQARRIGHYQRLPPFSKGGLYRRCGAEPAIRRAA